MFGKSPIKTSSPAPIMIGRGLRRGWRKSLRMLMGLIRLEDMAQRVHLVGSGHGECPERAVDCAR